MLKFIYLFVFLFHLPNVVWGQMLAPQNTNLEQAFADTEEAKKQALSLKKQGESAYKHGNYPESLDYYQKSLEIYQKTHEQQSIAEILMKIGIIYNYQGKYPEALAMQQKSLQIFEKIDQKAGIANCLTNIGGIYINQKEPKKALLFFSKSLKIDQIAQNRAGIARSLNNVGGIYTHQKNYDSALFCFYEVLAIEKEIDANDITPLALGNIAEIYSHKGHYRRALEFYQKSDSAAQKLGDKLTRIYNYLGIALIYQHLKDHAQSRYAAEKGLKIAQDIGALREYAFMNKAISDIHKKQGNYAKSLEYYEIYKQMNDSLFSLEKQKALRNLEIQGELDKKNIEIEQEKEINYQQKLINYWTFAGLMLSILLLVIILISKNKQEKAKAIIVKQKENLDQSHQQLSHTNQELGRTVKNLHKTQAQLVQSEKTAAFGLIMATISHEINNPINYMKGSYDFLDESTRLFWYYIQKVQKIDSPEEIKKLYIKMELQEAWADAQVLMGDFRLGVNRIIEIVQNLKTFIRLDEQGIKQADLSKNFEAVLTILRSRFLGKIEIKTDFDLDLPLIDCNISQINQVFLGLLLNASEAITDKGIIKVTTFDDAQFVIFSVADNGKGIPQNIQSRIFEPFVSSKEKSAGLGLYIAKEIVGEHQGKIQFETSEKGTIFSVFLPKN